MAALSLFDLNNQHTLPYQAHSATSKAAARSVTGQLSAKARMQVLAAIIKLGVASDEEIQDYLLMNSSTERPRRGELAKAGYIEKAGKTTTRSGRAAVTWRVTSSGLGALDIK